MSLDPHDRVELTAWRLFGADVEQYVDRMLAGQGDKAEPGLIAVQHALTDLNVAAKQKFQKPILIPTHENPRL